MEPPPHSDIASFATAIRLLKRSIDALIDEQQLPVTLAESRALGDWFFLAAQSAFAVEQRHVREREGAAARLQLLSKLGALAETMDHESIIDAVARLSIPELSDWCIVDIVEHGQVRRGTIVHSDPAKATVAEELSRFPSQLQTLPVGKAALAGVSSLVTDIEGAIASGNPSFIAMIRRLDMHSAMVIPFVVMGEPVAMAVFATTSDSGRTYNADDLRLAEEMARRAAQIIENARLHQELRRSEARFRLALQHANISVFETDRTLRFTWGYNSMLGVSDSLATGKTLSEVVGREVGEAMDELKRCVIATGEGVREAFSPTIDGKRRHLMVRYEPLRDDAEIIGITGATIDVTDVKEAEELLARELAFRERMMGILGHDLRNPVSAVLALSGLMGLHDGLNDKAREQLAMIERAARRMNEMIGTLLDFTRLRFHGSLPVAFEEIELDELARGVVAELQAADRRRAIELSTSGNLKGRWDPGRIAQMLSNLATNALAHGARETPISLALTGHGDLVSVRVSNRGPTIPPSLIDQLFEPFQQGAESAGTMRRGLGLGLFIVREIVRAHGGSIDVQSQGELTTFTIALPRTAASIVQREASEGR
jgi:PAS domain S-box-containing protein